MSESEPQPPSLPLPAFDLRRLARHLTRTRGQFSLAFLPWDRTDNTADTLSLIRSALPQDHNVVPLEIQTTDPGQALLTIEHALDSAQDILLVTGLWRLFPDFATAQTSPNPPILRILNLERERLRRRPISLLLLLPDFVITLIAQGAADFWSWRSGVFSIEPITERPASSPSQLRSTGTTPEVEFAKVPQEIERLLAFLEPYPTAEAVPPRELATASNAAKHLVDLYMHLAQFSQAEQWRARAIELFERIASAGSPEDRAAANNSIAALLIGRPLGDRSENLARAISLLNEALETYQESTHPSDWAMTQGNLANAYQQLPTGDRAANLRRAIEGYTAALRVYTEQDFPQDWAMTQNNLALAYSNLPTGDRAANLLRAIESYTAALQAYTEQDFPQAWATTQNNLASAYSKLPTGDRAANLQRAIEGYTAALRVYTEQDFPADWAMTQNNLANAYGQLPTGDRATNLQQAIDGYTAALRVRTEQDFPDYWARTQNNLANAYRYLPTGDRAANLQRAIAGYTAALRVHTKQDFPQYWATTQTNLAIAWADLANLPGEPKAELLRRAIACGKAALTVLTPLSFPQDHDQTFANLKIDREAYEAAGFDKEVPFDQIEPAK